MAQNWSFRYPVFVRPNSLIVVLFLAFVSLLSMQLAEPIVQLADAGIHGVSSLSRLPLAFVPNVGRTDSSVQFQVDSIGGTIFFTPGEVVFSLPTETQETQALSPPPITIVRLRYMGANPSPEITAGERLPGIVNYLIGNDPSRWKANLSTYTSIIYKQLYPGIDLVYYGNNGELEYDFVVKPGADPSDIALSFSGVDMTCPPTMFRSEREWN